MTHRVAVAELRLVQAGLALAPKGSHLGRWLRVQINTGLCHVSPSHFTWVKPPTAEATDFRRKKARIGLGSRPQQMLEGGPKTKELEGPQMDAWVRLHWQRSELRPGSQVQLSRTEGSAGLKLSLDCGDTTIFLSELKEGMTPQ